MLSAVRKRKRQNALVIAGVMFVFLWLVFLFLATESAIKSIWIPMVEKNTGTKISVKSCSLSFFRKNTFDASGLKITGNGVELSIPEIQLRTNLIVPVFTGKLRISELLLTRPELKLIPYSAEPPKTISAEKKGSDAKKKTESFPIEIVHFKASEAAISFRSESDYGFSVQKADLELRDFIPGKSASMTTEGTISADLELLKIEHTEFHSNLKFTVPENGFLPKTFALNLKSEKASVSSANFLSENTALAMIAEFALEGNRFLLRSCSVSVSSENAGDILAIRMNGVLNSDLSGGTLDGSMKIFPSPLMDAVLSESASAQLSGVQANGLFQAKINQGKLDSKITVSASVASIQGNTGKTQPIRNLSLHTVATCSGTPAEQTCSLHSANLILRQNDRSILILQSSTPWEFLKGGNLSFLPVPKLQIAAQKFPLHLPVAFGLDPKYEKETVSFSLHTTGPAADAKDFFSLKCSTSFPVLGLGPLSAELLAEKNAEGITLRKGNLICGTKGNAVSAQITGSCLEKNHSFELQSKWNIRKPELFFPAGSFEPGKPLTPVLSLSGNWNPKNRTFHFWTGIAGGVFRSDFLGEGLLPEENNTVLELKKLRWNCSAAGENCLLLEADGTIPTDGTLEQLSGNLNLKEFNPVLFRYLPSPLPAKFDLSAVRPALNMQIQNKQGKLSGEIHLAAKEILVNRQQNRQAEKWDTDCRISAEYQDKMLTLSRAELLSSLSGKPILNATLKGTIPLGRKPQKIALSLTSDRMELSALQGLFSEENPVQGEAGTESAEETPGCRKYHPVDLSRRDGSSLLFTLNNITCANSLKANCQGRFHIEKKNAFLSLNMKTNDNGLLKLLLTMDPSARQGCVFRMKLNCSGCQIKPFCEAFAPEEYRYSGVIDSADIELKGCGFSADQFKRNAQGTLQMKLSSLEIPFYQQQQMNLSNVLELSIYGITDFLKRSPSFAKTDTGRKLNAFAQEMEAVKTGKSVLTFASGDADLALENGLLQINSFCVRDGSVDSEELRGELNLQKETAHLYSQLEIGSLKIPTEINGTFQSLEVDYAETVKAFAQNNLQEILEPENLQNAVDTVRDLWKSIRKK